MIIDSQFFVFLKILGTFMPTFKSTFIFHGVFPDRVETKAKSSRKMIVQTANYPTKNL